MQQEAKQLVELTVDGERIEVSLRSHHLLVDVLRDGCGRTGVKEGCESAGCGACTVLIDGHPTLSCITPALDAVGREITTAESLESPKGQLRRLQQSFVEHHAIQCGFCTPGMLVSALALLESNPRPTEDEVRTAIAGNLCRCTGYIRIVRAIIAASQTPEFKSEKRAAEAAR